jgi:hypothetical protein
MHDRPSIFETLGIVNAVSGVIAPLEREADHAQSQLSEGRCRGLQYFLSRSGPTDAQTLLLLLGFPSASHMFGDLVPRLADRFHLRG